MALILACESSCDEIALALVDEMGKIHFETKLSQIELHQKYGGVVPELASRSHFDALEELSRELRDTRWHDATRTAATMGPGLVGPLLVGASYMRGLAAGRAKKFTGIHHLRAHVASALLDPKISTGEFAAKSLREKAEKIFPAWVLLVSGGHSLLLQAETDLSCTIMKKSSDDAPGECFDKCAKMLGLPYPGGPSIEKASETFCRTSATFSQSRSSRTSKLMDELPRPKSAEGFSFAGLKTAFRRMLEADRDWKSRVNEYAHAIEGAIVDTLVQSLDQSYRETDNPPERLVLCGGVSANARLRAELAAWSDARGVELFMVPTAYSTDNAVMVALAAHVQADNFHCGDVFARGGL